MLKNKFKNDIQPFDKQSSTLLYLVQRNPNDGGFTGFECASGYCATSLLWCDSYVAPDVENVLRASCPKLMGTLKSESICRNKTFWKDMSCGDGIKDAEDIR